MIGVEKMALQGTSFILRLTPLPLAPFCSRKRQELREISSASGRGKEQLILERDSWVVFGGVGECWHALADVIGALGGVLGALGSILGALGPSWVALGGPKCQNQEKAMKNHAKGYQGTPKLRFQGGPRLVFGALRGSGVDG